MRSKPEKMTFGERVELFIIAAPILWGYIEMIRGSIQWLTTLF